MEEVTCIGRCLGCDRMRRVRVGLSHEFPDGGICEDCVVPPRGIAWAERAHKCRTRPEYAQKVYDSIQTQGGKKIFRAMFPNFIPAAPEGARLELVPTGTYRE